MELNISAVTDKVETPDNEILNLFREILREFIRDFIDSSYNGDPEIQVKP